MNKNKEQKKYSYRWIILGMAWFCFFFIAMAWYIMPTLEYQLHDLYNINSGQFSTVLTLPFLISGIVGFAGGMLADRLGIKKAASLGILISGLGILLRANVAGYSILLFSMIILGLGMGLIMPNLPKLVNVWFPPEEMGLATGIYNTGLMGGLSTGLIIAPFIPGWQRGNIILGIIIIFAGILFYFIARDAPPGKEVVSSSFFEGISIAVKSKSSWCASIAVFFALAGMVSFVGGFPGGLNSYHGIPMPVAGRIASLISYLGIAGSLTLPVIAAKLHRRKLFIIVLAFSFSLIIFISFLLGSNQYILWLGAIIAGYLAGGTLPLIMEVPAFLPQIKSDPVQTQHVGGVSGMLSSLMNMGGFVGLPFIVMPVVVNFGYSWGFLVAGIIFALQGVFVLGIEFPEK